MDALFPRAGISMVEILERLGHKVVCPEEIVCCGQPPFAQILRNWAFQKILAKEDHSGNQPNWRQLARPNILSFLSPFGSRWTYKIDDLNKFICLARHFTEKASEDSR